MTELNIADEAVRAAQNFLIQRDWRVPYDTVRGALQATSRAIPDSGGPRRKRELSPERIAEIDARTEDAFSYPEIDWAMSAIADLLDHIDALEGK